ncbi:MAG: tRNA (cytidine(56)-2'-O)-methyltransferase [Candidatus Micrarchaeota archaeon]
MINILRLGHRPLRDKRITTHCALVARAFGADAMAYTGARDGNLEHSVSGVVNAWGGNFKITHCESTGKALCGKVVHLTMYGEPLAKKLREIRQQGEITIVIGGEKVPGAIYRRADYNIAVGSQPHSEVAALAVFLHEYFNGKELEKDFCGSMRVVPSPHGKKVERRDG